MSFFGGIGNSISNVVSSIFRCSASCCEVRTKENDSVSLNNDELCRFVMRIFFSFGTRTSSIGRLEQPQWMQYNRKVIVKDVISKNRRRNTRFSKL